jgi:3,4-dehydroadipyl-CoA semialdehyde dehydrogenase
MQLQSYLNGEWQTGSGAGEALCNPVSGAELARASGEGLDLAAALAYSREHGATLRALSFVERAGLLRAIAEVLVANRESYVQTAQDNSGNTLIDAAIDIDGGMGTLKYYASLGKRLGDANTLFEPGLEQLTRDENFRAGHLLSPITGVAVHINAFNFPSWGLWEKVAVALLAGVPVLAKPATTAALLSYQMVRDVIEADVLPAGALSLICGGGRELMNLLTAQDAVAFTGSADTALKLRSNANVLASSPRFTVEADSVNAALLGPDAGPDSAEFQFFIKEVAREMTVKAGQKCTAIRRIFVPAEQLDAVASALVARLGKTSVGDPRAEGVRMGPLVNRAQAETAWRGIETLASEARILCGGERDFALVGDNVDPACFVPPTLLCCDEPSKGERVHDTEVFGPVATLMPYRDAGEAFALIARGGGSLVCSVFSGDDEFAEAAMRALAPYHGRLLLVDASIGDGHSGHGIVMPQCVHGGPGRAGGGEELGGLRGLRFYHQRSAVQASQSRLAAWQEKAATLSL